VAINFPSAQVPWTPNNAGSQWISDHADVNVDSAETTFTYVTTFTLPAGITSFSITGNWLTDNNSAMYLNGNLVTTIPVLDSFDGGLQPFSINTLAWANLGGSNTLSFDVTNASQAAQPNPAGLRVEITGAEYQVIPEPGTFVLIGAGFVGLALLRRKRAA
jgi:hypothetical protein